MNHEQSLSIINTPENHYLPTEELAGQEAAARAIFTLHRAQRFPRAGDIPAIFDTADIWNPSRTTNTAETSQLFNINTLIIRSFRTESLHFDKFTKIDNSPYSGQIPVRIKDKIHTIRTEAGEAFVFADHTNSLIPSSEFFSYAKIHDIPLDDLFVASFCDLAFPSFPEEFDKYLEIWNTEANNAGLTFNKDRVLHQIRLNIQNGQGAPMHCYLALPSSGRDIQDKYITLAKQRMLHQQPTIAISGQEFFTIYRASDGSLDPDKLSYLTLYESFPVDIAPTVPFTLGEKTREFQREIAMTAWQDLNQYFYILNRLGLSNNGEDLSILKNHISSITEFIAIGGRKFLSCPKGFHDVPQIPWSYSRYAALGIVNIPFFRDHALNNHPLIRYILNQAGLTPREQLELLTESKKQLPKPHDQE